MDGHLLGCRLRLVVGRTAPFCCTWDRRSSVQPVESAALRRRRLLPDRRHHSSWALSAQGNLSGFTTPRDSSPRRRWRLRRGSGVHWAFKTGGLPVYVMPLVSAGAPLVNVLVTMAIHPPKAAINPMCLSVGFLPALTRARDGALLRLTA